MKIKEMNLLGVYIHIPFCVRKCDYCDFLSAPSDEKTMEKYVNALIKEIEYSKNKMAEYLIDTVFIGGGTPSILEENLVVKILDALRENCQVASDAEITVECNPGTVTEKKFAAYQMAGVNRISFGLQSTDNEELKSIGRIHSYEDFLESYRMARACGFQNINVDLMSALPGQTIVSYRKTLEKVLALKPEHISAYSLIVEDGTKMKERVDREQTKGNSILPKEEEEREMYYLTKELLSQEGYECYEISNYAKKGYACRHNIGYWKRKDYLGFGIGAASLYQGMRYRNIGNINSYMNALLKEHKKGSVEQNQISEKDLALNQLEEDIEKLSLKDIMAEFMFLGLRMTEGISIYAFEKQFGKTYREVYGEVSDQLIKDGLLEQKDNYICLTERGVDVSNYVMAEFL